ncbi:MAG: DNA polymerase I, partial [Erysipelotrichaceae bacterium]|nr:DNA polymerase I [Erysipelotrichaceae bacterium]
NTTSTPTNALYLFSSIILKLIEEKNFDDILVALDSPGKKFRHQEFSNYKANRKEVPIELKMQFAPIKEFLNLCNIKTIEIEGYEADDIIGTLAKNAKNHDVELEIYTGDRDLLQLINDNVTILMMHKGLSEVERFTKEHLKETMNISPSQIIDLKSLMGDSADNIPGVKGIGEKTAFNLIEKYGTLNNIYQNIDSISGKVQEKLINDKQMAYLSYELATIATDVPLDLKILDDTYQGYDKIGLNKFFKQYNIKSLLKYTQEGEEEKNFDVKLNIVDKISKDLLKENSMIYVDIDNDNYHYGNIRGIAIANDILVEYITIDFLYFDFDLIDYLANKDIKKDVFDSKQAYISLKKVGITLQNVGIDILLASYLLHADFKDYLEIFTKYDYPIEKINKSATILEFATHACKIAKASYLIKNKIIEQIKNIDNQNLLFNVEQPLALILANMELNGVLIDVDLLKKLDEEYSSRLQEISKQINKIVNHEININSPKQLAELLYDELKLPCNKKRSTGADDLKRIENLHEVVPLILAYRKYAKLLNTYIESFQAYKFSDNRIHAMFNQAVTMTGRLSSSQPNLQNLSIRDDERKIIRKLVIAPKGYKILSLDYSQIELRILAYLSQDENLLEAFNNNLDIHSATAAKIFNIDISKVNDSQRRIAKATNFGIVYGISTWGLSEQIDVPLNEAKEIINKFFETFPKVKTFLDSNIKFCEDNGYVTTMLKRRREINEIHSSNYNIKEFGKRVAMNTPIQGSAADVMKLAMIKVDNYLKTLDVDSCKMICQIHDELIFEVKEEIIENVKDEILNIMENILDNNSIKLKVSYAIGNNWLEAK